MTVMHDSGNRSTFPTGAVRDGDDDKPRLDLISVFALRRLGHWLRLGAKKYGERNWEVGFTYSHCTASLCRHLAAWQAGETEEDHLAAIMCNAMFLMHYQAMIARGVLPASIDDMPCYEPEPMVIRGFAPAEAATAVDPRAAAEPLTRHILPMPGVAAADTSFVYLASPYSHADAAVRRKRFHDVCEATAQLLRLGHRIFSPIAHSHPLAETGHTPATDLDFWLRLDRAILAASAELWILTLPGWQQSDGISVEIGLARLWDKPMRLVNPVTLNISGPIPENIGAGADADEMMTELRKAGLKAWDDVDPEALIQELRGAEYVSGAIIVEDDTAGEQTPS